MHTGRLFEIIYLLMDRHQMTTGELARELEVSPRTIRRDVEALSAAGVPVYMTRGKGGGVHLLPNYVLNKSVISETEQTEILAALSALRSTGVSNEEETPERFARIFQRDVIDWIDIDFSFWGAPAEYKQAFEIIRDAITSRHLLQFDYYDVSGTASVRTVEPVRLVFKETSWYLRAFCLKRNDWRTFKLIRMNWKNMQLLEESFDPRPLPYSLDSAPIKHKESNMKLLFEASAENRVREEFAPDSIELQPDGRFLVSLHATLSSRTHHYLLSYGAELEVLEPESLRIWVKDQAHAISQRYQS